MALTDRELASLGEGTPVEYVTGKGPTRIEAEGAVQNCTEDIVVVEIAVVIECGSEANCQPGKAVLASPEELNLM